MGTHIVNTERRKTKHFPTAWKNMLRVRNTKRLEGFETGPTEGGRLVLQLESRLKSLARRDSPVRRAVFSDAECPSLDVAGRLAAAYTAIGALIAGCGS